MSRPISRTKRFWHWLEGDGVRTRAGVVRMPPGKEAPRAPAAPPPPGEAAPAATRADPRAGLVAAFNPTHPIRHARDLRGRKDALDALGEAMLWQKQHAVVHGPRGSGKTSLVRIFADRADRQGVVLIYVSCEAKASFADLMRPLLQTIPASNMAIGGEKAFRAEVAALGRDFAPQAAVALLNTLEPKPIVFILDEFDRIEDREVRDQVASAMKLLSDTLSPVQFLIVGIAGSVDGLIDSHPSLRRHMTAIGIGPIADREVERLVTDGGSRAELAFGADARRVIVTAACGSPYHARLFAYSAGSRTLARQGDTVTRADAIEGLVLALERWSRLNRDDAGLFRALTGRDAETRRLLAAEAERIARDLPAGDETGRARELLSGALAPGAEGGFRDTTAAQYLIAATLIADAEDDARG